MSDCCRSVIESMGVYLPSKSVSTEEIVRSCKHKILYPVERITGVRFRRMVREGEFSIDLAKHAVRMCLERSKYTAGDIDILICCNISRYDAPNLQLSYEPSTSAKLRKYFSFANAMVFDISNACAGMFTAINIIDGFIKSGLVRRGMVVSGEYISHITKTAQYEINGGFHDSRMACLSVGDSGAALILDRSDNPNVGFHDIDMYTLGHFSSCCIAKPTRYEHGGAIMYTDSVKIHDVAIKESVLSLVDVVQRLKSRLKLPKLSFDYVIMHQTARTAIQKTASLINELFNEQLCTPETMIDNVTDRGNTSTTTHFVALWDNILNHKIQSQQNILFAIQASGITIGSAPYTLDDLPDRLRSWKKNKEQETASVYIRSAKEQSVSPETRVRIESIGTIKDDIPGEKDVISMASMAAEDCLEKSAYERDEIDLLIHAGVYRNDFLCEPALATMIAGKLGLNEYGPHRSKRKTFAYDIFNGAVGFLNACYNAIAMIRSTKFKNVMVVTSEIENNKDHKKADLLGIKETGSAMILDHCKDDSGFGRFLFRNFTEYLDGVTSHLVQKKGISFISCVKKKNIENLYIECIVKTVEDLLQKEDICFSDIKAVFPPQISSRFIEKLSKKMDVLQEKFVDIASEGKDFFTSSVSYPLQYAREHKVVGSGDIGLIIGVGSGIQVGCALYHF